MQLPLQYLFAQPASRLVLLALEVLLPIAYHVLVLCISIQGRTPVSQRALQLPSRIPAIMSALHVTALAQHVQELAPHSV